MVTLRMLGIAVAILVGIPVGFGLADHAIGHFAVPGGEVVDMTADAVATITNVTLADPPQIYERNVTHNWPEQLVEGHTVFVQLIIPLIPNETQFTVDIIGDVECTHHVNASGPYVLFIPVPNRVHEAHVECRAGETVFVTPDPFIEEDVSSYSSSMEPTGIEIPFVAPNGIGGVAREYSYTLYETDWTGQTIATRTLYAWSVPTIAPFTHVDGSVKRWYCPIPIDRIEEMGVTSFDAYVADDPDDLFAMME